MKKIIVSSTIILSVIVLAVMLNLAQLSAQTSDPGGSGGSSGAIIGGCKPTAANPSYSDVINYLSCTLSGWLRVSVEAFNILIEGEDQTNHLLATSGGSVRTTVVGSGLAYAADCSAAPTTYGTSCTPAIYVTLPVNAKTFTATLTSSTSGDTLVAQTIYIYGGNSSSFTSDTAALVCTITFPAATQSLLKGFTQACPPVTGNWLYYGAMTFGTDAGAAHATRANVTSAVTATY